MDKEAFKLPKKSDSEQSSAMSHGHVQPSFEDDPIPTTAFSRLVQKIGTIFARNPQANEKLSGRIKELQTMADTVHADLVNFKTTLQNKINPHLFSVIITIIEPLIKEIGRTPPAIAKNDDTAHQVKLYSRYVDCIEKAKVWIEIGQISLNNEGLEQALIQQAAIEFVSRIDRDIQVIQDYLSHAFSAFELSEGVKTELKERLMPGLTPNIFMLHQLKQLPADLSLDSFMNWRSESDKSRETLFGEALHIIDDFSSDYTTESGKEKEVEHLDAIVDELNSLEGKIVKAAFDIKQYEKMDQTQRKAQVALLERLEAEAHKLNCNLHLSFEHGERIEQFLDTLIRLREDLT
jgi:hypothetical protein